MQANGDGSALLEASERRNYLMKIFVSRPSIPCQEFIAPMNLFLRFLEASGINSVTLGVNSYTIDVPLQAVCESMETCCGAIILGVPQKKIFFSTGLIGDSDKEIWIETPWNHIEGAIAYRMDKPIFVIAHSTITSGIFDRGVTGKFVVSVDMRDENWYIKESVQKPLVQWISRLTPPR